MTRILIPLDGSRLAEQALSYAMTLRQGLPAELVSLVPLGGDARGVTTRGLARVLHGDTLWFGSSRGVSNEMTSGEAGIQVGEGLLLVVHGSLPAS